MKQVNVLIFNNLNKNKSENTLVFISIYNNLVSKKNYEEST